MKQIKCKICKKFVYIITSRKGKTLYFNWTPPAGKLTKHTHKGVKGKTSKR